MNIFLIYLVGYIACLLVFLLHDKLMYNSLALTKFQLEFSTISWVGVIVIVIVLLIDREYIRDRKQTPIKDKNILIDFDELLAHYVSSHSPNKETLEAMHEAEHGINMHKFGSFEEMIAELEGKFND